MIIDSNASIITSIIKNICVALSIASVNNSIIFMTLFTKISKVLTQITMYNKKNKEAADLMIHEFCQKFCDIFHIYPHVTYSISKQPLQKVSLNMLFDLVNELMMEEISDDDPIYESLKKDGIRLASRKRLVVLYRQTFMSIANDVGYGSTTLSRFLGFNHATVIHGCRKIRDLIEIKDPETLIIYTQVTNAYKIRFNNDGDVQPDSGEESDT